MNQGEKIEVLKYTISELSKRYENIQGIYRGAQIKMFTFMGAGFGLLTYLFTNIDQAAQFKLPEQGYGKIFFAIASFLILTSLYKLFVGIRGVYWEYPLHIVKLKEAEEMASPLKFYTYVRDEYIRALQIIQLTYDEVYKSINDASVMLAVGGILVILIKVFNQ